MKTTKELIEKKEQKIAKIIGVFRGNSSFDEGQITTSFSVDKALNHKELKKVLKLGKTSIKRSGAGMRVIIIWYLK